MSIVCLCDEKHPSSESLDSENCKIADYRGNFHRFLDNLSVEKFVDYISDNENHFAQIENYFNRRDCSVRSLILKPKNSYSQPA